MPWKPIRAWSIKEQLIVWLIGPFLVLSIVSTGITYWLATMLSNEIYDELLFNTLDSVIARIDYQKDRKLLQFEVGGQIGKRAALLQSQNTKRYYVSLAYRFSF